MNKQNASSPTSRLAPCLAALLTLCGAHLAVQAQTASAPANTPAATGGPTANASPRAADKLIAMCIGCHNIPGYQASFPEVHKVPMIAGQNAKYLQAALAAYKSGDRKHPTMKAIAASLSDQDMGDLAQYYATLPKDVTPVAAKPGH